jgi:hypothetical protein
MYFSIQLFFKWHIASQKSMVEIFRVDRSKGIVGGLLLRRKSSKQKHLRQDDMQEDITRRYMPKLQFRKLRHDNTP